MPVIQLFQYFVVDIDGSPVQGGSLSRAKSVVLGDGEISDQTFKVAPTTAVKVWDKTVNAAMGNFDFLWIETDLDVLMQFTTDAGTRDDFDTKKLKGSGVANQMGPALVLGSDDTLQADGTIDLLSDGTADTIDEIWVYNEDATDTARVRRVVAT